MTALPVSITASLAKLAQPGPNGTPRLALKLSELARAWGMSERALQYAVSKGELSIPHFRVGQSRLYPIDAIQKWMAEKCRTDGTGG